MVKVDNVLGRIEINTVDMPIKVATTFFAHFTYTGTILMSYVPEDAKNEKDYYYLGVMNQDGSSFRPIFEGVIPSIPGNNGIRFLPMADNKRIITGDYVIECNPDIDHCVSANLVQIHYLDELSQDRATIQRWTEIIMAPDAKHICWTTIRAAGGSVNFLGELVRKENAYYVEDAKIISDLGIFSQDEKGQPFVKQARNGELKQFIKGGSALSIASSKKAGSLDSMIQYFEEDKTENISNNNAYEETAIFSPDENLAICMSTRFSPGTNGEIFALCPRPLGSASTMGFAMVIYTYGIMDVRHHRHGNIGPVLIDVKKQQEDSTYMGINLMSEDRDEEWVYSSPMSWHPDGKHVLWNEVAFGPTNRENPFSRQRIRMATLLDYVPGESVKTVETPKAVYGIEPNMELIRSLGADVVDLEIKGGYCGRAIYTNRGRNGMATLMGETKTIYENYSDDGKTFYNGEEYISYSAMGRNVYLADLVVTGEHTGRMNLQVTYEKDGPGVHTPYVVNRGMDENGKSYSYGYVEYDGKRLTVEEDIKD